MNAKMHRVPYLYLSRCNCQSFAFSKSRTTWSRTGSQETKGIGALPKTVSTEYREIPRNNHMPVRHVDKQYAKSGVRPPRDRRVALKCHICR